MTARLVLLPFIAALLQNALGQRCRRAMYNVTFQGLLTSENLPESAPTLMFSPLTAASHSTRFSALVLLGYATEGVRNIAELGDNTQLIEELSSESAMPFVMDISATDGPFDGDQKASVIVRVDCSKPVITALSMVAPSPDWFVAAANINMYNGRFFVEKMEGELFAYDAGTDSGTTFMAPDMPTSPRENIVRLGAPLNMPVATYTIQKMRRGCRRATYRLTVFNEWTTDRFPDAPDGNVLSPLTAFSHTKRFSAFTLRAFASPGVKRIAEEGDNSVFLEELASDRALPFVKDINTTSSPAPMGRRFSVDLEVDCMNSYVSFISMLFPSPDWIVAVSGLNTMVNGMFPRRFNGTLFAYDAGTDSGETPTADNMPTDPPENIVKLREEPFNEQYVARYVMRKLRRI